MARRGPNRRDPDRFKGQKIDWALVRGAFRLARPFWVPLFFYAVASMVASGIRTVPPLFFRALIDNALPNKDLRLLTLYSASAIGINLFGSVLGLLQRWQATRISAGMTFNLRVLVFEHVQSMPISFYTRSRAGAVMSRINNDVTGAQDVLTSLISSITTTGFGFVATYIAMILLDWRITLVISIAIPGFLIPAKYMGRVMQRITRERMNLSAGMNAFLQERVNVSGALLSKLFGNARRENAEFRSQAQAIRDIAVRVAIIGGIYGLAMGMYGSLATSIVYWFGGWLVITSTLSVGTVIAFGSYAQRAYTPARSLGSMRIELMTAAVSLERVFEILDFPNRIADREGAFDLVVPRGEVRFENVRFAYPRPSESTLPSLENPLAMIGDPALVADDRPTPEVLKGISFTAHPGEVVALVGPTGAGKTTTLSLVARLYEVSDGAVKIDGHDVRDLTLESLRAAIGFVSQDPHLFHDTIRNNLLYARPDATEEEMVRACEIARIHSLIASLLDGYDTIAGDRGYRLSGGEKQRVAIARMILKNPQIVVLDEATSHLDSENEALIKEALAESLAGRTTLAIAHRLSTIVGADKILVIDQGRVVEEGRHEELIRHDGLYRKLYDTQFGRALADVAAGAETPAPAAPRTAWLERRRQRFGPS